MNYIDNELIISTNQKWGKSGKSSPCLEQAKSKHVQYPEKLICTELSVNNGCSIPHPKSWDESGVLPLFKYMHNLTKHEHFSI